MSVSIPKGTRDFGPAQMVRRQFIFDIIRRQFQLFGFQPLETPAMENLSVLMGKYGEEGDRLIFKVLNSGDYLKDATEAQRLGTAQALTSTISEKALRYDLTVPFARYVVMNQGQLTFPFRRYQMQPVWRADRPQRGRYREFYQCDADVVGTNSLQCEAELLSLIHEVFTGLNMQVEIRLNSRKLLAALAEALALPDKIIDLTVAIDKLDKIGVEGVEKELTERGFSADALTQLHPLLSATTPPAQLAAIGHITQGNELGAQGMAEIETVRQQALKLGVPAYSIIFDPTLARGLNYYTGCIIEVKSLDAQMGSIAGGGRYDDLTGVFGSKGLSGVGVSFGIDRIYDVMEEKGLFPDLSQSRAKVLFVWLDDTTRDYCLKAATRLRRLGIATEVHTDGGKLKKQLAYADKLGIPHVAIVGPDEMAQGQIALREMKTGVQQVLSEGELDLLLTQ